MTATQAVAVTVPAKPRLDIDGDGKPDLLTRSPAGRAHWWSSKALADAVYRFHGEPQARPMDVVALGNVRGDRRPEVLQLTHDGRLSLHTATASGTQAPTWTGGGWQIYNRVVGTADLTGDGRPDVVARTFSGDLYLYRATGSATGEPFAGRVKVGSGWQIYDQLVGVGDLDRDGKGDLLGRDRNGDLYSYKGTGSAAAPFAARKLVGGGWNTYSKLIGEGDWHPSDGRDDVLVLTADKGRAYEYKSHGNGVFSERQDWHNHRNSALLWVGQGNTPVYGKPGLTGVDASGRTWMHENRLDRFSPNYDPSYNHPTPENGVMFPQGAWLVMATGVDGTGLATVMALKDGKLTHVTKNVTVPGDFSTTNLAVGPGDLTGDGKGDLLTRDTTGMLWLRAGRGDGVGYNAPTPVGGGWNVYQTLIGSGDINGDGRTDLVARDRGNLYFYPGTGKAAAPFGGRQLVGGGWTTYNAIAATGDQNGDGRADIVGRDSGGTMWVYRGTGGSGTGTFAARQMLTRTNNDAWSNYTQIG
ncbi:VCBS repeat-containing protein [Streptomyces sp. NPDC051211]|uniref:FG-GAP repeat domain-containing protein n=1 Tax=Streptomyces sp. NPDC051211 TaxID=3154643 RepID=UPI00344F0A81